MDAVFSLDGSFIIVAGEGAFLKVLRSHNLEEVHQFELSAQQLPNPGLSVQSVRSIELSWDNRNVLVGMSNGALWVLPVNFTRWYPEFYEQLKAAGSSASSTPTHMKTAPAQLPSEEPATVEQPQNA